MKLRIFTGIFILSLLMMTPSYAGKEQRLEDAVRNNPDNADVAFNLATVYCESGQTDKCLKAMAYVVSIEPLYSTKCSQYLQSYGYTISEEDLKEAAINEVLDMTGAQIALFYYDRLRLPDIEDIERILKKQPFISFKNPYTGNSIYLSDMKGGDIMIEVSGEGIEIRGFKRSLEGKKMPLKALRYRYRR